MTFSLICDYNDYNIEHEVIIIMTNYSRDEEYIKLLSARDYTVKELAQTLFVSEPTVRRDIIRLKEKDLVICERGNVRLKNIIALTTSAKTAIELAASGIHCACTGGVMHQSELFCYGPYSEEILKHYYSDVAFFSCTALDSDGTISDTFLYANTQRRVMIENSKKQYLLCDSSKLNTRHNHTLCNVKSLDGVFCDIPIEFDWQKQ